MAKVVAVDTTVATVLIEVVTVVEPVADAMAVDVAEAVVTLAQEASLSLALPSDPHGGARTPDTLPLHSAPRR